MVYELLIFAISLVILVKGSDVFIDTAVLLSKLYGFSQLFIGIALIGIGTSLPELMTGVVAALTNNTGIIMGNILGSNIANTTLVLGAAAVMVATQLKKGKYDTEVKTLFGTSLLFLIVALDGRITWQEGAIFLFIFSIYLYYKAKEIPKKEKETEKWLEEVTKKKKNIEPLKAYEKIIKSEISYRTYRKLLHEGIDIRKAYKKSITASMFKNFCIAAIALLAILISSRYLVSSAVSIASALNVNAEIVGLTAIALGTSLPELSVAFSCARKGLPSLLIGNIIGSNMTNILLVGGITSFIIPLTITKLDLFFVYPFMILTTFLFLKFLKTKWLAKVFEGTLLIFFYCIFILCILLFAAL